MAKKKTVLPNDYERMIPEYHKGSSVYGEHIARYRAIGPITKGKVVLDIASGSGYGTAMIAKNAKRVLGVDVSEAAVAYASENYSDGNIEYKVGDGVSIPADDNSFDIVTSFETIEHIEDYETFMRECKRVLKDDGMFLLSTPNDVEFAEGNHFHLHEFNHNELMKLVKKYFKNVKPYYQATWVGSMVGEAQLFTGDWEHSIETIQTAPIKPEKYLYFYFLCSNRPITESVDPLAVIGEHWSERQKVERESKYWLTHQHAENLEKIVEELRKENKEIKSTAAYKVARKFKNVKQRFSKKK